MDKRRLRSLRRRRQEIYEKALPPIVLSDMPRSSSDPGHSRVEDIVLQLLDWEEKIGEDLMQYDKEDRNEG